MNVHFYEYMYVCMYVYACLYVYVCIFVYTLMAYSLLQCIYAVYKAPNVLRTYIHLRSWWNSHHKYIHAYILTYTSTYIHTCAYIMYVLFPCLASMDDVTFQFFHASVPREVSSSMNHVDADPSYHSAPCSPIQVRSGQVRSELWGMLMTITMGFIEPRHPPSNHAD